MEDPAGPVELNFMERLAAQRGRPVRDRMASARVTKSELAILDEAAKQRGLLLGEWVRKVLLREAESQKVDPLWTEVIANRMLLMAVLRPVATGQKITPERFDELLSKIKSEKRSAAHEVMAQYKADGIKERNNGE